MNGKLIGICDAAAGTCEMFPAHDGLPAFGWYWPVLFGFLGLLFVFLVLLLAGLCVVARRQRWCLEEIDCLTDAAQRVLDDCDGGDDGGDDGDDGERNVIVFPGRHGGDAA